MARAYLDHHASTPLAPAAREAIARHVTGGGHGNPSSVHAAGRLARKALEDARERLAEAVRASSRELVFTSGGTEAVHLAVGGVGEAAGVAEVWCDPGAHPCLRAACEGLAARAGARFAWVPLSGGALDARALGASVGERALVAVSLVQHETGAVAPWAAVRDAARAKGAVLVADGAQALGKVPLDLPALGAAAVALSAHKIGGPAGVGALWLRAGERVVQRQTGGGQERGVRAGTENLLGAVGFGAAASALSERLAAMPAVARRRDRVEAALLATGGVTVNAGDGERVATACHVSVEGVHGQELVAALDLEGVEVSSGSACSSGRAEPSESLLRLYPGEAWRARGALRVTLGPETTDDEVELACAVIPAVIARLRATG